MSEPSTEQPASVEQPVGTKVESTVEKISDGTEANTEPKTETDAPEKSE